MSVVSKARGFLRTPLWALCILLAPTYAAASSILFTTFYEPAESFRSGTAVAPGFNKGLAVQFTSLYDELLTLTEIHIPLSKSITSPDFTGTVTLFSDGGSAPGASIESWNVLVTQPFDGTPFNPLVLVSALNPGLQPGTQYWLGVQDFSSGSGFHPLHWHLGGMGSSLPISEYGRTPGLWEPSGQLSSFPAFSLLSSDTPETTPRSFPISAPTVLVPDHGSTLLYSLVGLVVFATAFRGR